MAKFKVGDKVRILDGSKIKNYTGGWNKSHMGKHVGEVYKITHVDEEWGDSPCAAYMLNIEGICRHARWDERGLALVTEKIVITTDGKTTTAVLYEDRQRIKEAKAVCAPTDEFDFNYGASLALSRLNDDETTLGKRADKTYVDEFIKPKYFTGKVRCVRVDPRQTTWLTKGKIYEFLDGYSINDCGDRLPLATQIHSIKELNKLLYSDFEEVIEKKSQMDRFLTGEIGLEVPTNKTMEFLKECEKLGLRWHSGDKPTAFNVNKKCFVCKDNDLFFSRTGRDNVDYVWETWDEVKDITEKEKLEEKIVDDIMSALEVYINRIKDDLND